MTATCIFCGASDEVIEPIEDPVCDRPECEAKAKEYAWHHLLRQFIETKTINGIKLFRLRGVIKRTNRQVTRKWRRTGK